MSVAVRPALVAALLASLVGGCYSGPPAMQGNRFDLGGPRDGFDPRILRANPSKVIATELAFARAAQDKGQWTAFAEFATEDAVMFVPEAVTAQAWLKGRANPPQAVRWQPHQVWSSCDGSLAVTRGAWQRPDGSVGYFTTVWQRQENREYKWVMDQGDALAEPLPPPEMIGAVAADCTEVTASPVAAADSPQGQADDETLWWSVAVRPDLSRTLTVDLWRNGEVEEVLRSEVAAPRAQ